MRSRYARSTSSTRRGRQAAEAVSVIGRLDDDLVRADAVHEVVECPGRGARGRPRCAARGTCSARRGRATPAPSARRVGARGKRGPRAASRARARRRARTAAAGAGAGAGEVGRPPHALGGDDHPATDGRILPQLGHRAGGRLRRPRRRRRVRLARLERVVEHLVHRVDEDEAHARGGRRSGTSSRSFSFRRGRMTVSMPARCAASTFSLMPPTGRTLPRSVISPVIATFGAHVAAREQRGERGRDRDAGRRAVLRDGAGGHVDVDVARSRRSRARCRAGRRASGRS